MQCPACGASMESRKIKQAEARRCTDCHGTWVRAVSFAQLIPDGLAGRSLIRELDQLCAFESAAEGTLICPDCKVTKLWIVDVRKAEIDVCRTCHGMFFDPGEVGRVIRPHRASIEARLERRFADAERLARPKQEEVGYGADILLTVLSLFTDGF